MENDMRLPTCLLLCIASLCLSGLGAQTLGTAVPTGTVSINATSTVAPIHQGTSMVHMAGQQAAATLRGCVWSLPNGTLVSDLSLSIDVTSNSTQDAALVVKQITPQIPGMSIGQWEHATPTTTPFSVTPALGAFADDTLYVVHMLATQGSSSDEFFLIFVVGEPTSANLTIHTYDSNGIITGDLDVSVGQTVASLGLSFSVANGFGHGVAAATTISNAAAASIDESEFKGIGIGTVTFPGAGASGAFTTAGTHSVRIHAWGVREVDLGGGAWSFEYFSAIREFDINVTGSGPQIVVSDSTGPFAEGSAAAGDRDFGQVDMAVMPVSATITLSNKGGGDLQIGGLSLAGAHASDFALDITGTIFTIAGGSSTSFEVLFDAATTGTKTAEVRISHGAGAVFSFQVAGIATTAAQPLAILSPTTLPDGIDGAAYLYTFTATGGMPPYSWFGTSLPAGWTISTDGILSAAAQDVIAGAYTFEVTVSDTTATGLINQTVHVNIQPAGGGGTGQTPQAPTGTSESAGGCSAAGGALAPWLVALLALACIRLRRAKVSG
jgi:hypothetical protein